ncbi:L,D-transpeptidase family protein [Thiomicrorhabdus sediminis]|uniref:L,D-transpeptidase n=1 Tax=Thiomicrorhabdus sediminis TaxID=2580412 RepID=A0A4P9K5P3_9GAMM|nr:L,D-transpeptidase [Thiomicrorhabdus sediminis]QCU89577.1 L,D-transpeptidase [Thiomicrorhabdus sediminis]
MTANSRCHNWLLKAALAACLAVNAVHADEVLQTEQKLINGLQSVQQLQLQQALTTFEELGERFPKYKLAHLLKADLLAAKAGNLQLIEQVRQQNPKSVARLIDEAEVRWQFSNNNLKHTDEFNDFVLKSAEQKHIILVSLQESRLYVYKRDAGKGMQRIADYYVTMGRKGSGKEREGDLRTPIGVYHIVDLLPGSDLPDLYGVGALPLNYPNIWDKSNGKTGSGIWLHGVPSDTYIRAPRASRGCVVLNNKAMERLLSEYDIPFATPVVIVDQPVDKTLMASSQYLLTQIQAWLADNQPQVNWQQVSVFRYPNEKDLFYVTFPDPDSQRLHHQFWKRDGDGDWIVKVESADEINKLAQK